MNSSVPQEALAIQAQIEEARQRLAERDRILTDMEMLDSQVKWTRQQLQALSAKAKHAKLHLDAVRGRVLPVVRGWLAGEGSPEEQTAAAEKVYHAAVADVASQQKALAALEQEQEALEVELLEVAAADDELRAALEKRDQYLIAHGGKLGRELAESMAEVDRLHRELPLYQEALAVGEQTMAVFDPLATILLNHDLDLTLFDTNNTWILRDAPNPLDVVLFDNGRAAKAARDIARHVDLFQHKLAMIGQELELEPQLNWRALNRTPHAWRRVETVKTKLRSKKNLLYYQCEKMEQQIEELTIRYQELTKHLWQQILGDST